MLYSHNDILWPLCVAGADIIFLSCFCLPLSWFFSERERRYMLSPVRLLSVSLSVTLVHPTQAVVIFGNISMAFGTVAIRGHPLKISQRSFQGNPSAGEGKHKTGSQI